MIKWESISKATYIEALRYENREIDNRLSLTEGVNLLVSAEGLSLVVDEVGAAICEICLKNQVSAW